MRPLRIPLFLLAVLLAIPIGAFGWVRAIAGEAGERMIQVAVRLVEGAYS